MQPTSQPNPLALLVAIIALALGSYAVSTAVSKKSCECPRPQWHDNDREDDSPRRRRRPDGSTGSTGEVKTPASVETCPGGNCPPGSNGVVKRDM